MCVIAVCVLGVGGMSVGSGFLWWNYYGEYKQRTDFNQTEEFRVPLIGIDMQSERAYLISSIVATVLTVSWRLLRVTKGNVLLYCIFRYSNT